MSSQLSRLSTPVVLLVAVVAIGVLGDGIFLVNHFRQASQVSQSEHENKEGAGNKEKDRANKQHPCNHGFYVSQAAHAKKGGDYVKQIAQGDLGKNGDCKAPLPAPGAAPKTSSNDSED